MQGNNSGVPILDSLSPTIHFPPFHLRTPGGDLIFCTVTQEIDHEDSEISPIQHNHIQPSAQTSSEGFKLRWETEMEEYCGVPSNQRTRICVSVQRMNEIDTTFE